jgi:hypothetical protein
MYENFIVVVLIKIASCSMYGWIKWLSVEDFGSSFLWNLDTFVGEYINFECYWNNCDAKLKTSLDIFPYTRLRLWHVLSDSHAILITYWPRVRAVRENIQPRSCCIDRAIARSTQQDRGWIFSRTARTVEVSKFFIIWTFVKKWKERSREGKMQSPKQFAKKNNCKKCSLG